MTWILGSLLFCVFVLLGAELAFEGMPKNQTITSYFLSGIAWTIAFWLFYSLILWGISSAVTAFRRRKIPKQYRQKMKNRIAFLRALIVVFLVYVSGSVYGCLARENVTPKVEDLLCVISIKRQWHKGSEFWADACPISKSKKKATKSTKNSKSTKPKNSANKSNAKKSANSSGAKSANTSGGAKGSGTKPANNVAGGAKTSFSGTKSTQNSKPANAKSVGSSKSTNPNVAGSTNKDKVADSPRQKIQ